MPDIKHELLTPSEVAALLRINVETLAHWRCERRKGRKRVALAYTKAGRILYKRSDVEAFIASQRVVPGEPRPQRSHPTAKIRGSR